MLMTWYSADIKAAYITKLLVILLPVFVGTNYVKSEGFDNITVIILCKSTQTVVDYIH